MWHCLNKNLKEGIVCLNNKKVLSKVLVSCRSFSQRKQQLLCSLCFNKAEIGKEWKWHRLERHTKMDAWKPLNVMNVHYLTRTDAIRLTRGIRLGPHRCFFNHGKTTVLFVSVGSGHSTWRSVCRYKKKKSMMHHNPVQNQMSFFFIPNLGLLPPNGSNSFGKQIVFCLRMCEHHLTS